MRFSKNIQTTFTVTVASPAVFSCTGHELAVGDELRLETTGALPTGLTASTGTSQTKYYVIQNGYTANTFQVSASKDGNAVNTSGTQSGTHYFIKLNRARLSPNVENTK